MRGAVKRLSGASPVLCTILALIAASAAPVVLAADPPVVTAQARSSVERLRVGETAHVSVTVEVAEGWHINGTGVQEGLEFLVPTSLSFEVPAGLRTADVRFPDPVVRTLQLAGAREIAVYEGDLAIDARLLYETPVTAGAEAVAVLRYQACTETLCTRPTSLRIAVPLVIDAAAVSPNSRTGGAHDPDVGAVIVDAEAPAGTSLAFEPFTTEAYDRARASKKAFVVEFTAEWCLPCKQMEERTFTDRRVLEAGKDLTFLSVDMTTSDRRKELILQSFGVPGAPTTLFFDREGREVTRRVGFIGPEEFARLLDAARDGGTPPAARSGI